MSLLHTSFLLQPLPLHPRCSATKDIQFQSSSLMSNSTQSSLPTLSDGKPPPHSSFHYNALIRSHIDSHLPNCALLLFHDMLFGYGCLPDKYTFPLVLKACAHMSVIDEGEQVHSLFLKYDHLSKDDAYVTTSLMHMYARCGRMDAAMKLFHRMPERNVVSWNILLDGFVKSGDVETACCLFVEMPERNIVSWNSVIGGHVRNDMPHEALKFFLEMMILGLMPDEATMVSVVSAISDLGLLCLGRRAHGYVIRRGFSLSGALGVLLIDLYSRCGSIGAAYQVFLSIPDKNVGHWTSMIVGFAAHGHAEASLGLFAEMIRLGVEPNYVTFIGVLNACSHGGLVNKGFQYFNLMRRWGIRPRIQHYGCLVDLVARAGLLDEAMELVRNLPMEPGFVIWSTLLAACRSHGSVEITGEVAQKLIEAEPDHGGYYVLLSNMYASMGRWEDFTRMRKMVEHKATKSAGSSWIEVDGNVHAFVARDEFHPRTLEIHLMLDDMKLNLRCAGYEPMTNACFED
ncbi:pentatricopeptide repeat-containing protein At5g48910-like [Typha latifolia]|uniref:pentatricopeptide repeat-containing protein At5g48910-like n=1 Tax=Typha latifolia TaxID=4733 RepID=UPI003C2CC45A